jgi:hypothetical protein
VHIGSISNCHAYKNPSKNNLAYDALDGMAYYMFLKALRILEEFKKNPHIKSPPKSPSTNFQSLAKFFHPLKFKKIKSVIKLSVDFGLAGTDLPCHPTLSQSAASLHRPSRPMSRWHPAG